MKVWQIREATVDEQHAFVWWLKQHPRKDWRGLVRGVYHRIGTKRNRCVYCHGPHEVGDHVPPIWHCDQYDVQEWRIWPACNPCNRTLGAVNLIDIEERRDFIKKNT